VSELAPHAVPRGLWRTQLRADIASGDAFIREFDAVREAKTAPHPARSGSPENSPANFLGCPSARRPLPQAGEGSDAARAEQTPPPLAGEGSAQSARVRGGGAGDDDGGAPHRFAKDQLKAFVERIERLAEEKKAISDDIGDVYAEAKANGFDKKALHAVVRLRAQDVNERKEHEAIVETYLHALGML
jgi:uncharacterized protein (UPF0335 family)